MAVIKGTVYVPMDYTQMMENMYTSLIMFQITFAQPCASTTLDPFSLAEITASLFEGPVSLTFP